MNTLHKQVILNLADCRSDSCISIFISTNHKEGEVNKGKNQILFKKQIQRVRIGDCLPIPTNPVLSNQ